VSYANSRGFYVDERHGEALVLYIYMRIYIHIHIHTHTHTHTHKHLYAYQHTHKHIHTHTHAHTHTRTHTHAHTQVPFADLFNHKTAYTPLEYEVWTQEGEEDGDKVLDIDVYDADEECDVGNEDRKRLADHEQTMCLASATSKVDRDVLQVGLFCLYTKSLLPM
jgi:hypothetical protein